MSARFAPRQWWIATALLVSFALISCSSDSNGPDNPPPGPTVVDQVKATISTAGGALQLKNGISLAFPNGSVTKSTNVVLTQYANDDLFNDPSQVVLGLEMDGAASAAHFKVPLKNAETPELLGAAKRSADGMRLTYLTHTSNSAGDTCAVDLASSQGLSLGATQNVSSGTYVIEAGSPITLSTNSKEIAIQYYEQDGGNCWAACWLLWMRAYEKLLARDEVHELLAFMDIEKDSGLNWRKTGQLKTKTKELTRLDPVKNTWISYSNFVNYVVSSINADKPVMVNLISHQGVFVGYDIQNPGPSQTVTLIYHDPQNSATQTPYRRVTPAQLKTQFWDQPQWDMAISNYFATLAMPTALPSPQELQTIEMMDIQAGGSVSGMEKGVAFARGNFIVDGVYWDHTFPRGYRFEVPAKVMRRIDRIHYDSLPVWNMASSAAPVTVDLSLHVEDNGVPLDPPVSTASVSVVAPPRGNKVFNADLRVDHLLPQFELSDTLFVAKAILKDQAGTELDDFDIRFKYVPLRLDALTPTSGQAGDQIFLTGIGFGNQPGKVEFTQSQQAEIVSWNPGQIKVKVPAAAAGGPVVVIIDDDTSNAISFSVAGFVDKVRSCSWDQLSIQGVFEYSNSQVGYSVFDPVYGYDYPLRWNGMIAQKEFRHGADSESESLFVKIELEPGGQKLKSVIGYLLREQISEGKVRERTTTTVTLSNLPFSFIDEDAGNIIIIYELSGAAVAGAAPVMSRIKTDYNEQGQVTGTTVLTRSIFTDPAHNGRIQFWLHKIKP